jgi:hypothetical protein
MPTSPATGSRPAPQTDATSPAPATKPLAVFRFEDVSAAVFPFHLKTQRGPVTVLNVSVRKSYKDADGKWQHSHSLGTGDLLPAALALQKAYEFASDAKAKNASHD